MPGLSITIGKTLTGTTYVEEGSSSGDSLLLETGDYILLETGDKLLLE